MGITHRAQVHAAFHCSSGKAHYTAAVGDYVGILRTGEGQALHIQLIYLQASGGDAGIHLGAVLAVFYAAGVIAGDAPGKAFAAYAALRLTVFYAAVVFPCNAAHVVRAGDFAIKAAIFYGAVAAAHQAAHLIAAVVRLHPAFQVQIHNAALLLEIAEEALMGAVGGQDEIADGMAAPVKAAAEAGYGVESLALQVQVIVQLHLQSHGILHQSAVYGKSLQVLHRGDVQNIILGKSAGQQPQQQSRRQGQGKYFPFHSSLPPVISRLCS